MAVRAIFELIPLMQVPESSSAEEEAGVTCIITAAWILPHGDIMEGTVVTPRAKAALPDTIGVINPLVVPKRGDIVHSAKGKARPPTTRKRVAAGEEDIGAEDIKMPQLAREEAATSMKHTNGISLPSPMTMVATMGMAT